MKHEKRFLSLLLAAFVAIFAACEPQPTPEPQPQPQPPVLTLDIELTDIGINSATMSVTPSDNEATYIYDVIQQSILNEHHEGSVATYVENLVESVLAELQTIEAVYERISIKGASSYTYQTLSPETEYVAFAVALNTACEPIGEPTTENFTTLPMPEMCSWEVTFDEMFYDGVSFTVTPSDDTVPYYFTVRPTASYGSEVMNDEELLQNILYEDGMMIDYYLTYGVYESVYDPSFPEFICCSDTGYEVLVFAYSDGAPLTSIKRFPFRTLKSDVDNLTFDISVTPSTDSADVTITPSDEYTMYMWDVVDRSDLNDDTYGGDIATYVDAYIANMIEMQGLYEIDFARIMGEDSNGFAYAFTPYTDYVVWAAQVDEFGEVVGEIATKEFTTLADDAAQTVMPSAVAPKMLSFKGDKESARGSRQ